jgi:hypothetical protein
MSMLVSQKYMATFSLYGGLEEFEEVNGTLIGYVYSKNLADNFRKLNYQEPMQHAADLLNLNVVVDVRFKEIVRPEIEKIKEKLVKEFGDIIEFEEN